MECALCSERLADGKCCVSGLVFSRLVCKIIGRLLTCSTGDADDGADVTCKDLGLRE